MYSKIYIRYGLVVRISAFHAEGPGSIPGVGIFYTIYIKIIFLMIFNNN